MDFKENISTTGAKAIRVLIVICGTKDTWYENQIAAVAIWHPCKINTQVWRNSLAKPAD